MRFGNTTLKEVKRFSEANGKKSMSMNQQANDRKRKRNFERTKKQNDGLTSERGVEASKTLGTEGTSKGSWWRKGSRQLRSRVATLKQTSQLPHKNDKCSTLSQLKLKRASRVR